MHEFDKDFYGYEMRAIVLGYIRPELDYTSRGAAPPPMLFRHAFNSLPPPHLAEALIDDIEFDKMVALNCLKRPDYSKYAEDAYFVERRCDSEECPGKANGVA